MKRNSIRTFFLKCFLILIPFICLIIIYIVKDPFRVVRTYADCGNSEVCQSEGKRSWEKYKLYRDEMHYDSFIMGSSCTRAFLCTDWNKHIHAHPFRFFSNAEGLGDLCLKLEALDRQPDQPVKHLLIITERSFFQKVNPQPGLMHILPPEITHKSMISYQTAFVQGFFNPVFLIPYLRYQITGKYVKSMHGVIGTASSFVDEYTNDASTCLEDSIRLEGENYWNSRINFKKIEQKSTSNEAFFTPAHIKLLYQIRDFCNKYHTDLKLVIGPSLEFKRLNPKDLATLKDILGSGNVFDFSGDESLNDYHNFYDGGHYRVTVGRDIMNEIYGAPTDNVEKQG